MVLTGAQILVEELIRHGTDTVFGYPGGTVLDIYDALYVSRKRIKHVTTAHEQGAVHAADGFARVTGRPGVVISTSGPGATNLVTGIANAYLDSVPLVAVTGNVAAPLLGKDSFQEVDIVGVTQPIVKHNFIVHDVRKLADTVREAFALAASDRKGPVLVDIPKNIQRDECEYEAGESRCQDEVDVDGRTVQMSANGRTDAGGQEGQAGTNGRMPKAGAVACHSENLQGKNELPCIDRALEAIRSCERPYIYCGGGVVSAGAENEVLALSKKLSAPIGLSMMGLTAIPESYELNLGMSGMHGKYAATLTQSKADLMIAAGVRFSDRATGDIAEYTKNCTVIHIDIDEAELGKNIPEIIELCGDAKQILRTLTDSIQEKWNEEWVKKILMYKAADNAGENAERFSPANIIRTVRKFSKDDTVVATDVGQHQMWVMQHYGFTKPRTLLTSGGLGAMGYGLGASIGGCLASGRNRTVLFTGDGSFGMNLTELATAVSQGLPLTVVLLNNGTLGMVRQWQGFFYSERYSCTTLERKTDFVALAKAFGADGCRVDSLAELEAVLDGNLPEGGPFVLDCRIDIDEKVFPMIPPGGSVKDIMIGA
ncbi:MAG: biosynthetic-type acetolactate synthase large subunit [Clostridiales Family XIII bacterium]|jgi:acetolactate synthase-1/2/3 large subunit|nr:biosynthetic-type acetolactate synthase large subunit [Clostridiales Family XIII bacterium]